MAQNGSIHYEASTQTNSLRRTTSPSSLLLWLALLEESKLALVNEREGCSSGKGLNRVNVVTEFGGVSLESISFDSGSADSGADTHDTGVDGARHAVLQLDIDLWECEVLLVVCEVVLDISAGGTVDHLSHLEALDGLVLGDASGAVVASHGVLVTAVVLGSTVVSSL